MSRAAEQQKSIRDFRTLGRRASIVNLTSKRVFSTLSGPKQPPANPEKPAFPSETPIFPDFSASPDQLERLGLPGRMVMVNPLKVEVPSQWAEVGDCARTFNHAEKVRVSFFFFLILSSFSRQN